MDKSPRLDVLTDIQQDVALSIYRHSWLHRYRRSIAIAETFYNIHAKGTTRGAEIMEKTWACFQA